MKKLLILLIQLYQKTLSLDHGLLGKAFPHTRVCRFYPSCSEYSKIAIDRYGVVKGGVMSVSRVIRCNPSTPVGTYDPVP